MTYALGQGLQVAIYDRLIRDPGLDAVISGAVYDTVPDVAPDLFVAIGQEKSRAQSDGTARGAIHEVQLSVVSRRSGYSEAKGVAGMVSDLLVDADLTMVRGRVVSMRFLRAQARRDEGEGTRRIDLWFRARVDDATE